jgi:hypothetical protein
MISRIAGLLGVAGLLAAVLAWEIVYTPDDTAVTALSPRMATARQQAMPPAEDHLSAWTAEVLARPLFSPDRRPAATSVADAGANLSGLPRLTGILVGPFGRRAIFAAPDSKPIVVGEGDRVAMYRITGIDAEQVHLIGPQGARVMRPRFLQAVTTAPQARAVNQAAVPR